MIIITQKYGQLGNRLILFSHLIAFAIAQKVTLVNLAFDEYADLFQPTSQDLFCRYPPDSSSGKPSPILRQLFSRWANPLVTLIDKLKFFRSKIQVIHIEERQDCLLDSAEFLHQFNPQKTYCFQGFRFRDESNLIKYADQIREYFTPVDFHQNNIKTLIQDIRSQCEILIGVHIRHGDYQQHRGGEFFFTVEQYVQVMQKVAELFPQQKVGFLVCSDAEHHIEEFADLKVFFGNNHLLEDLYALAACDYLIGPMSTYSTWASFYGKVPLYRIYNPEDSLSLERFKIYVPGMDYKYPQGLTINARN
ncbi:MAG: alpha-1,2-fucosyltransferase [Lyngbya sp.]|nr:alpha-1,2-fucosyltransferase [Lyngbya sp.]